MAKQIRLPLSYQEVEYLSASGSQYILTDVIPDSQTIIEMTVKLSNSTDIAVGTERFCMELRKWLFWCRWDARTDTVHRAMKKKYIITGEGNAYADGELVISISPLTTVFDSGIEIFRVYYNKRRAYYGGRGDLCHCNVQKNNKSVLNLYPCYRKSDNKPGMYDLVNNQFYTNAGTGEFGLGPDVNR